MRSIRHRSTGSDSTHATDIDPTRSVAAPRRRLAGRGQALVAGVAVAATVLAATSASGAIGNLAGGGIWNAIRPRYSMPNAWPSKWVDVNVTSGEVFIKLPGGASGQ